MCDAGPGGGCGGPRGFEHAELARAHNARWLPWLTHEIIALGLKVHPSLGNFILIEFPAGSGRDAAAASAYLEAEGKQAP